MLNFVIFGNFAAKNGILFNKYTTTATFNKRKTYNNMSMILFFKKLAYIP